MIPSLCSVDPGWSAVLWYKNSGKGTSWAELTVATNFVTRGLPSPSNLRGVRSVFAAEYVHTRRVGTSRGGGELVGG